MPQIAIAGFLALVAFFWWMYYRYWKPRSYFQMVFPKQYLKPWPPENAFSQKYQRRLETVGDEREIQIAVFSNGPTKFRRIDIRLVRGSRFKPRRGRPFERVSWFPRLDIWHWDNELRDDIIEMTHLRRDGRDANPCFTTEKNKAGGLRLFYDNSEPQSVLAEEFIWFTAKVRATERWEGHISFEAAMDDGRKARNHKPALILPSKVQP